MCLELFIECFFITGFPLQYIAIPCFFYGFLATSFSNRFKNSKLKKQILLTVLIIALTILLSSPFNGILWHLHDIQARYFPNNWLEILITDGTSWGLSIGWFIILTSIPYNIFGSVIFFFLLKKVLNYLILTRNNQPIISNINTFREFFRNTFVHTH